MAEGAAALDRADRRETADMGMWTFLGSEVMLFGAVFLAIAVYRWLYPEESSAASQRLYLWLGGCNTAILLTSSLTMALGVEATERRRGRRAALCFLLTAALGAAFLGVKSYEYWSEFQEGLFPTTQPPYALPRREQLFLNLYYVATGLHAIHLSCGIVAAGVVAARAYADSRFCERSELTAQATGLYWHLVDVVWVFLYPLLYLAR
jgi:cytochrome c oxidase subunit 3